MRKEIERRADEQAQAERPDYEDAVNWTEVHRLPNHVGIMKFLA